MVEPEDWKRVSESAEERIDRLNREAQEKYAKAQLEFRESKGWKGWKNLQPGQRRMIGAFFVLLAFLIGYLIYSYWGIPGVYPRGEGG